MIIVKYNKRKVEGIINLNFNKIYTIHIQYIEHEREYRLRVNCENGESILLASDFMYEKLEKMLELIINAYYEDIKVMYLSDNILYYKIDRSDSDE